MMKFNQQIDTRMYTNEVSNQPTKDSLKRVKQFVTEEDLAEKALLEFVDQLSSPTKKEYTDALSNEGDISPDDMNEVIEYYRTYHRPVMEFQFFDFKGQQLDRLTHEQIVAAYHEIRNTLSNLPIPPHVFMFDNVAFTAVWEIPEQRRFLSDEEFNRVKDNFVEMIRSIGISTPVLTEDFYDSELKFEHLPMFKLYKDYQEKIKPLQLFDQISGLGVYVTDAKQQLARVLCMVGRE